MMSRKQYRWLLGATAFILSGMLVLFVLRTPAPPVAVSTVQAGCEDVFNSVTVKGTVRARRESRVSVLQPARVEEIYVSSGDTVEPGTALARVSYTMADVSQEAAAAVSAFFDESIGTPPSTADGEVLYAEMGGTVAQTPAQGDLLLPGVTAVRIADFSRLTVETKVPELYAGELSVGQEANITPISNPNQTLAAELHEIAPYAVQTFQLTGGTATATVLCTLGLREDADGLMPGSTVDVKLFTDRIPDAVTVPYAAVRQDGAQEYVFVIADGVVRRRDIETGYQLSQGVQIKSGLQSGEWVVSDGTAELTDGQQVTAHANS